MAEAFLPVVRQPLLAQGQNLGAEIGTMPVGQNKKPAVVGDQFESVVIILTVKIPADPPIAHRAFPRGGGNVQQPHPLFVIGDCVPQGCDRSWAENPSSDGLPSIGDEAVLRCAQPDALALRRGSQPIIPPFLRVKSVIQDYQRDVQMSRYFSDNAEVCE
jgi:hypothetical protein